MKCKYEGCESDVLEGFELCILHIELPHDETSDEYKRISELKDIEVKKKKDKGDFNFKGVKLVEVNFSNMKSEMDVVFSGADIKGDVLFNNAQIGKDAWFDRVKIGGHVSFDKAEIEQSASFFGADIEGYVSFDEAKIGKYLWFEKAQIKGDVSFNRTKVGGSVSLEGIKIGDNVSFHGSDLGGDLWFGDAHISGNAWFDLTKIKGKMSFKNTQFKNPKTQEKACRKAKTIWEKLGDRENADYYFYREMEAKRKLKPYYIKYPELIVQYPFGYGVYPYRLLLTFALTLFLFAFVYWILEGIYSLDSLTDTIRFSFLTMIIPAYGVIKTKTGIYGIFTILEAVIGAFTWPTFIVTFARKYMR